MNKLVGYVRRADGGVFGEVYEKEDGTLEVMLITISRRQFKDIVSMKKETGLGGWLYDFEIVVHEQEI